MSNEFSTGSSPLNLEHTGGAPSTESHLDIKQVLVRRTPLAIGVFALLIIPALGAAWFLAPFEYEATATLHFLALAPRILPGGSARSAPYAEYVATQMALLEDDTVLNRLLREKDIASSPILVDVSDRLAHLKSRIGVNRGRGSELVKVTFRSTDHDAAQLFLEKLISTYFEYTANIEANSGGERMTTLMQVRDSLQNEVQDLLAQMAALTRQIQVSVSDSDVVGAANAEVYRAAQLRAEDTVSEKRGEIVEMSRRLARLEELQEYNRAHPSEVILELGVEDRVAADRGVSAIREQFVSQETGLEILMSQRSESSPSVEIERETLAGLRRRMTASESDVRRKTLSSLIAQTKLELEALRTRKSDAQQRADELEEQIAVMEAEYETNATKTASVVAERDEINLRVEESRNILLGVRQEIRSLSLESSAEARVRLASGAVAPATRDMGRRYQFLMLAFMVSMGAGVGVGFLREITDQHVYSPRDVARLTGVPVLASIPHLDEERLMDSVRVPLLTADFPYSHTANEYQRILSRVVYPSEESEVMTTCLVTGPTKGDGKTSVACNLALMLARAGRRVLLVDACPQAPKVESSFDMTPAPGLADLLRDGLLLAQIARPTTFPNLDILGPGLRPETLAGELAAPTLMQFLEDAEHEYDHIVIDSPPALLMSEAKLLAPIMDGVVIVAGVGISTRGMIRRCMDEFHQVGADVSGIVLNRVRRTRGGYFRKNLDAYYRYTDARDDDNDGADIPDVVMPDRSSDKDPEPAILLPVVEDSVESRRDMQA